MISRFYTFRPASALSADRLLPVRDRHKPWSRARAMALAAAAVATIALSPAHADEGAGLADAPAAPIRSVGHDFPPPPAVAPEAAARVAMRLTSIPARDPYIFEKPRAPVLSPGAGEEALARRAIRAAATLAVPAWTVPPQRKTGRVGQVGEDVSAELRCLALNVYWEARSETPLGRLAVASVTLNRVANRNFPSTVCEVVLQGQEQGLHRCQFSWVCDRRGNEPGDDAAWRDAELVAFAALFLNLPDPTRGALWYHADYVSPPWADSMAQAMRIGRHLFYRGPARPARTIEAARGATG
jgi:spore germination cell wall hydrolase CwlJ-like protein